MLYTVSDSAVQVIVSTYYKIGLVISRNCAMFNVVIERPVFKFRSHIYFLFYAGTCIKDAPAQLVMN